MPPVVEWLKRAVDWQARLVSRNPFVGALYLTVSSIFFVAWVPLQAHIWTGVSLHLALIIAGWGQALHVFAIFRRIKF